MLQKMKNVLKKIWLFIAGLWNSLDALIEKYAPIATKVVEAIKTVNESTTGDVIEMILAAVIPGKADDVFIRALREKLRKILPEIILKLSIAKSVAEIEDPNEQMKAILAQINLSSNEAKNIYYHGLCALILEALSDKKITWSESVQIAEYYYTNIYKK